MYDKRERLAAAMRVEAGVRGSRAPWTAAGALALALRLGAPPGLRLSGWLAVAGVILFFGSLYALALGGPRWLGPITPLGGVAFIVAWGLVLVQGLRA